jgi:hypothetical protein
VTTPAKPGRRYREYDYVKLSAPVRCPKRGADYNNFTGEHFRFFVEDGFFCIEYIATGKVIDTAPANVVDAPRKLVKPSAEAQA